MQQHGGAPADHRGDDLGGPGVRYGGQTDTDPDHRREHRVQERADDPAHDEGRGEPTEAVLDRRPGEVLDVLREGEARGDDSGIDDAVGQAVELVAHEPPHDEQEDALEGLLREGRDEHGGEHAGRPLVGDTHQDGSAEGVDDDRQRRRPERPVEEGGHEVAPRLGLEAVEPQEEREHECQWQQCGEEAHDRPHDAEAVAVEQGEERGEHQGARDDESAEQPSAQPRSRCGVHLRLGRDVLGGVLLVLQPRPLLGGRRGGVPGVGRR